MFQRQFIDQVQLTDLKLLVSTSWLSEVFQQTIHVSLLEEAGYRDMGRDDPDESALIQMLIGLLKQEVHIDAGLSIKP